MRPNWKVRRSVLASRMRTPIRSLPSHLRNSSFQFYSKHYLRGTYIDQCHRADYKDFFGDGVFPRKRTLFYCQDCR